MKPLTERQRAGLAAIDAWQKTRPKVWNRPADIVIVALATKGAMSAAWELSREGRDAVAAYRLQAAEPDAYAWARGQWRMSERELLDRLREERDADPKRAFWHEYPFGAPEYNSRVRRLRFELAMHDGKPPCVDCVLAEANITLEERFSVQVAARVFGVGEPAAPIVHAHERACLDGRYAVTCGRAAERAVLP